ncbi:MAG: MarR family transcriptional regulator [Acidobacteria bacterium]|nr:MarR family transcriptional regulator [Acidobacteriota bacterium]
MELPARTRQFILHWGEMASRWGINRTVAQIHALLFLSAKPLNAEELTELLSVSRSNVSTSLRELQGWGVVRVVHVMGDRRDHFECLPDVWEMFQAILDERKRRVIDPAIDVTRQALGASAAADESDAYARERLQAMVDFLQMIANWYTQMRALPPEAIRELLSSSGAGHSQAAGRRR